MDNNNVIFNRTAEALLVDYTGLFYVDAVTDEYIEYSNDRKSHSLNPVKSGDDFFEDMLDYAGQNVYEEDRSIFTVDLRKENLNKKLDNGEMLSVVYRLMMDGKPVYHLMRIVKDTEKGDDYFVFGVINIDQEMTLMKDAEKSDKERDIFNQIAESLAANYDVIYYVNPRSGRYSEYKTNEIYEDLEGESAGKNFFSELHVNVEKLIHQDDMERMRQSMDKDYILSVLDDRKRYSTDYRLMIRDNIHYARLTAMRASDGIHLIIGVENIDEDVRREKAQDSALKYANEMARRDELTGAKNKTAYRELEDEIQRKIDDEEKISFAVVVCDINDLKRINDTSGHKAGDEYIKAAANIIFDIFSHSPVFRIGGDEFTALLMGHDYANRKELFETLKTQVLSNLERAEGPVIASGISEYDPGSDMKVSDVFNRADRMMYENKKSLKSGAADDKT